MNGGGLSKLGTVLTGVFAVTLTALVAQLLFILWRRRKSQSQNRIGPHEAQNPFSHHHSIDVDAGDVFKWQQGLYGLSSRVLFTIEEEEEREALDSETTTYSSCAEKEVKTTTTVVLDVAMTVMRVEVEVEDVTPPFMTPCASPPYYTPSPSPSRDF